jgi:hypothetical protein
MKTDTSATGVLLARSALLTLSLFLAGCHAAGMSQIRAYSCAVLVPGDEHSKEIFRRKLTPESYAVDTRNDIIVVAGALGNDRAVRLELIDGFHDIVWLLHRHGTYRCITMSEDYDTFLVARVRDDVGDEIMQLACGLAHEPPPFPEHYYWDVLDAPIFCITRWCDGDVTQFAVAPSLIDATGERLQFEDGEVESFVVEVNELVGELLDLATRANEEQ